jgi:putative FmdB family regulatory protein
MPFYEYQCRRCQYYVEVMQKITDAPLKRCPSCGRTTLVKLVSAPVFRLKGSGWYETDFKSDKEVKRNLAAGDTEPSKPAEAATSPAKAETPTPAPAQPVPAQAAPAAASPAGKRAKAPVRAAARARVRPGTPKRAARGRSRR